MRYPNRPIMLDDTSGYNKEQQKMVNSILTTLANEFTSKALGQIHEDKPVVLSLHNNETTVVSNLVDKLYNGVAFLSFTFYSSSSVPLFRVDDKYQIDQIVFNGITSRSNQYYSLSNYGTFEVVNYNNEKWIIWRATEPLPNNTWTVTMNVFVTDTTSNYDSPVIEEKGVRYNVSSENNKYSQERLNTSLNSIRSTIFSFKPDTTKQEYSLINREIKIEDKIEVENNRQFYLIGQYNNVPVYLGTVDKDFVLDTKLFINTAEPVITNYQWSLANKQEKVEATKDTFPFQEMGDWRVMTSTPYINGNYYSKELKNQNSTQIKSLLQSQLGIENTTNVKIDSKSKYNVKYEVTATKVTVITRIWDYIPTDNRYAILDYTDWTNLTDNTSGRNHDNTQYSSSYPGAGTRYTYKDYTISVQIYQVEDVQQIDNVKVNQYVR